MLLFTVSIHELGHFFVGVLFKVNVKEVSIGIGPRLVSKTTKSGLKISLKLIPLVAYVLFDSKQLRNLYADEIEDKNYS
ncbi:MAG: site-2 protease family protein [Mycoplasmoidaceae bacterium]|nr:site-2 protease family protein [Mycoplasmoidaceae bacterium]